MKNEQEPIPVGRLAPSPTGFLHLGHARSFLLAWWHVRSRHGRLVLRLEDLDSVRVRPGSSDAMLRDLEWLGLDWDGSPYVQSQGVERIRAAARALLNSDAAYACVCSRAEVRTVSAPQQGEAEPRYAGTCRGRYGSPEEAVRTSGRQAGVRFRVPSTPVSFEDGFTGSCRSNVADEVGDFLILRRNATPAYQLAVTVDDAEQGVNEVLRGQDLLPSTARQYLLQRALGLPHPRWYHVPLVVDESGRRLAKRHGDTSIAELRQAGVDPRAIVAWVARSAGVAVSARVTAREILDTFDLRRVPREAVVLSARSLGELRSETA